MSPAAPTSRDQNGVLRVASGATGAGQYAKHDRTAPAIPALASDWPVMPNQDQIERAAEEATRRLSIYPNRAEDARTLTARLAYRIALQEDCYLHFKAGQPHPDDDAFEAIWEGRAPGFNRKDALERLAELDGFLAAANAEADGEDAVTALTRNHAAVLREALTCSGRNLSTNQIVVTGPRVAREELTVPF